MKSLALVTFAIGLTVSVSVLAPDGLWLWLAIFGASCWGLSAALLMD